MKVFFVISMSLDYSCYFLRVEKHAHNSSSKVPKLIASHVDKPEPKPMKPMLSAVVAANRA